MKNDENNDTFKPCRKCKVLVAPTAKKCPECGENNPAMTTSQILWAWVIIIGILVLLFKACSGVTDERLTPEGRAKGFHCLSRLDGSHAKFKAAIKSQMRDPGSFKHIETKIGPKRSDGTHAIAMTYRAANGFGGTVNGRAVGTFRNNGCDYEIVSVE